MMPLQMGACFNRAASFDSFVGPVAGSPVVSSPLGMSPLFGAVAPPSAAPPPAAACWGAARRVEGVAMVPTMAPPLPMAAHMPITPPTTPLYGAAPAFGPPTVSPGGMAAVPAMQPVPVLAYAPVPDASAWASGSHPPAALAQQQQMAPAGAHRPQQTAGWQTVQLMAPQTLQCN
jgi:hypothetical protein